MWCRQHSTPDVDPVNTLVWSTVERFRRAASCMASTDLPMRPVPPNSTTSGSRSEWNLACTISIDASRHNQVKRQRKSAHFDIIL